MWSSRALESTIRGLVGEFQAWFRTDADCLDYLDWLRWPEGFACPGCGHGERCAGEEGADGHCRGSPRPKRTWPVPDGAAAGCIGQPLGPSPGARVITDGWQGYHGVEQLGLHDRHSQRAAREGTIPTSCSRRSTGSPPWSSAGSWAPTKAQWATRTYPDT